MWFTHVYLHARSPALALSEDSRSLYERRMDIMRGLAELPENMRRALELDQHMLQLAAFILRIQGYKRAITRIAHGLFRRHATTVTRRLTRHRRLPPRRSGRLRTLASKFCPQCS